MSIELPSSEVLADLNQYLSRVLRIDEDAAVRITVHGTVAVISTAPLFPVGLGDDMPLALAMRMIPIVSCADGNIDEVVPASAVVDRLVRSSKTDSLELRVPPQRVQKSWTGIAPPRTGWAPVAEVDAESLRDVADAGVKEITEGVPEGAGAHAVSALRPAVWKRPIEGISDAVKSPVPAGLAFAMDACGFLRVSRPVKVFVAPQWLRLSAPHGHVLTRV